MNFVSSAGVLSRRARFEPAQWRARILAHFARLANGTSDANRIADAWVAEYGDEAAWHAARKIAELLEWDDHEGARVWTEVLKIIQERDRVRKSSGA
jgi:hypothetical protein